MAYFWHTMKQNSQLDLLLPLASQKVRELMRDRLLHGLKFFDSHTLRSEFSRDEVKLALLLVKIANPAELLSGEEKDLLESRMNRRLGERIRR